MAARRESIEDFPGHENTYFSNLEDLSCYRSTQLPLSLKSILKRDLGKQIDSSNLFQWLDIAEQYRIDELFQLTSSLICQHFIDLSSTEQFLSVDERRMRWIVGNEKLVTSEACLLEALIRWYKHSERNREEVFRALFQFIKLENIDSEYLRNVIKKENLKKVLPREMVCIQIEKRKKALLLRRKQEKVEMEAKFSNAFVITSHINILLHFDLQYNLDERRDTNFKIRYWQPFVGWTSDLIQYNLTGPPEEPLLCSRVCECRGPLHSAAPLSFWLEQGQFLSSPVVIDNKLYVLHHAFWCDLCHYPTALDEYVNDRSSAFDCHNQESEENLPAHLFCFDLSDHSCSIKVKLHDCRSSVLLRVGWSIIGNRSIRHADSLQSLGITYSITWYLPQTIYSSLWFRDHFCNGIWELRWEVWCFYRQLDLHWSSACLPSTSRMDSWVYIFSWKLPTFLSL